jgi:hypothetical protein
MTIRRKHERCSKEYVGRGRDKEQDVVLAHGEV